MYLCVNEKRENKESVLMSLCYSGQKKKDLKTDDWQHHHPPPKKKNLNPKPHEEKITNPAEFHDWMIKW